MTLSGLLSRLAEHAVQLKSDGGDLVIHCDEDLYDEALLSALRRHKPALLTLARRNGDDWWQPAGAITPDMLPLVALEETHIASIVGNSPGGAANVQDIYPLAPLQEGMLFHYLLARDGDPYLRDALFGFDSRARLDAFLAALGHVIDRHDILRTAIQWEGLPQPVQVVWYSAPLPVEEIELDSANGDVAQQLRARFDGRHVKLDLTRAPLLRAIVAYDSAQDRWLMLMLFHHLAIDHTALAEVEREVHAYLADAAAQLPEPVPFRNYVAQARLGVSRDEHEAFFREMLGDVDEPTLPFGLRDVRGDGHDIAETYTVLDAALARRLRVQARQAGVGVASLFHLAWAHVLARASGREDVVFGTVLFGRMQGGAGAGRALGMFINTLPLRVDAGRTGTREAVKNTHRLLSRLLRHEHASLSLAQRCSGIAAPTPLFSALLNYRHGAASADTAASWPGIESLDSSGRTNYPLVLSVDDHDDGFALTVQVTTELDAVRIGAYMTAALDSLAAALESNPQRPVRDLPMLPPAEREQVLHAWNRTEADYPRDAALHTLFEAQVERTPEATALVHEGVALSYAELNARANRIAHALIARGVGPDARVAICVERSIGMVTGLLGILKAGAAYVPLDPAYPPQRLAYMLEDCGPSVLLTQTSVRGTLPAHDIETLCLDDDQAVFDAMPEGNPRHRSLPDHLAYVIYTSGSTGLPKGVQISHAGIVNRLHWMQHAYRLDAQEPVLQKTPFSFDVSVWEIFWPLLTGARLVLARDGAHKTPDYLARLIEEQRITTLHFVPSMLGPFIDFIEADGAQDVSSLKRIVCSGEALPGAMARRVREQLPHAMLHNLYGPTEASIDVTYWPCDTPTLPDNIPIGWPLANTRTYILDGSFEPVPAGVAGELYLAGTGLARGYLNRPALTAERFVPDPFGVAGARMYRTGDLARHLPDGSIEYLGRNDDQVKLRGFRIELGEIGAKLMQHAEVRDAVVIARSDGAQGKRLVAYYTGTVAVDGEALRAHLLTTLPDYMIPAAYVRLDALPLTPNGKLDRKALPDPDSDAYAHSGYEAPQGEIETAIAGVWSDMLGVGQVGRNDNFFALGGHSLLAIGVIERMQRAGWRTDVTSLFNAPTLAALAETIDAARREGGTTASHVDPVVPENGIVAGCEAITPAMLPLVTLTDEAIERIVARVPGGAANVQDIYPLAPLQEGVLFHHLLARDGDPYLLNASFAFARREQLNAFFDALGRVIARHDILRTAIQWEGLSEPVQVVWRNAPLQPEEIELDAANGDIAQQLHDRFDARRLRLDLGVAPLLKLVFAHDAAQQRWVLLLIFHHLAIDHTGLAEVEREVHAYLADAAAQLPEPVPFRNYVAQARLGVSCDEHEAFFREMLGDVDEPTLPFGLRDVRGDGHDIAETCTVLDAALARRLRVQARQAGVGVASLFHLAWAHVLARASGRDDVVFGTVLFGRMQGGAGAGRALGMFINTLPLRVDAGRTGTREAVTNTHRLLSRLLRHEHASLSLAQRCSGIAAPTPLFSALLNYRHGAASADTAASWPGIESLDSSGRTNYPLVLSVDDRDDGFALTVQVTAELDAVRIGAYMTAALDSLAAALESNPQRPVRDLPMLPPAEREQVLHAWNRTEADYPRDATLHTLFEAQVERTPEATALVHEGVALSYAELNARANRIAHALIARGVGPDARVAICVERSLGMVAGLLGILKAGAAYVPLDPAYPPQRLAYMLEDCGPSVLLTQTSVRGTLPAHEIETLCLDDDRAVFDAMPDSNPRHRSLPDHLAYVIYTSGSTGLPKGVTVTHRNVVRLFATTRTDFGFTGDDVWTLFHSFAFDFSVWEVWGALLFGGRLVIVPKTVAQSAEAFYALVCDAGVTVLNQTPGAFRQLIAAQRTGDAAHRLRYVIFGGEALDTAMLEPWYDDRRNAATQLVNMYGITETTVHVSYRPLDAADAQRAGSSPIGRPLADLGAYLLDGAHEPVPRGVAGELYIAGAGLARGYLNRADLTAERFVPDPFGVPGARMYRTGDLARHLPDGTLEYLGRNDDQVKLRGFRIELGEIGARLARHPGVRDAVVIVRDDASGDKRLVAYYTGEPCETESLRAHLLAGLPEYMVPAAYVHLAALPLTPNGKLDRKALPAPGVDAYALREYDAPRGSVEMALAQIWSELLHVEQVGRQDNFFELGGHSLLAIGVIERMQRAGWRTDVTSLFNAPTLAALAETIDAARREGGTAASHVDSVVPENGIVAGCEAITPAMLPLVTLTDEAIERIVARVPGGAANVQDIYPLAPLQEGVLFHHLLARDGDPYLLNASFAFARREQLDAFFDALGRVIARHDILRTAIQWEGLSEPVQVVWRNAPLQFEEIELDAANGDVAQQLQARFDARRVRLDLTRAPLLRAIVAYDSAQDRWLMLMLFHHLAIDHTALAEVEREVHAYLADAAAQLPEPVPFRNYVAQARLGVSRDEHEAFFREMLGDVDEPTLPFGLRDVRRDGRDIAETHTVLDAALARRLRVQARQAGVGVASLFHLAWAHVLARASGRDDVVFGTVLFGRMQGGAGAGRALGMFINTLPVRVDAGRTGTQEAVAKTHRLLSRLLRHEHASLPLAQQCSGVAAPTPLFSALLNYRHGAASAEMHDDAARASGIESLDSGERTNYPLVLSVDDYGDDFALTVQTTGEPDAARIARYVEQALDSLAAALESTPQRPVRDLPMLPAGEREQVLHAWNRTDADYPRDTALHTLFEAQVQRTPQAVAVEHGPRSLTYVDLNDQANRLAHYLAGQGVKNGTRVAILLERSVETVIAEVAVVKCGAVYVPLDSQAPAQRQRFMLDDCGATILLAHSALASPEGLRGVQRIDLDTLTASGALDNQRPQNRDLQQSADAAAYIMYTSGSTGTPKGVIVPHRAITRLVLNCGYAQFGSTDRFGFASNPAFDASTLEVWGPLLNGARTVIIDQPTLLSPERLRDTLLAHRVDVLFLTVGLFDQYVDVLLPAFAQMRYLMIGGDVLTPALMARVVRQGAPRHLMNVYGPTEATTFSLYCRLDASVGEAHTVPIGAPLSNTRAYILDGSFEPVPVGVAGELYVGGDGLAQGYLNRPALTAERFVPDPFGVAGARMYRTGDLARHLPDGSIEYLGRNDDQVKLRGFRIELGEIGAKLMQHAEVRDAVVIARSDGAQGKRLLAYYTSTVAVDGEALRAHLLTTLPDYMIPAAYVRLDALPLTPNGKLDRKALPDPDSDAYAHSGYEAPQGEIETAIAGVWSDMLGVGQVGRNDNFFALGGHSLLAIGVIERMQRAGWRTDVTSLFNAPTLAALAETIDAARREGGTAASHVTPVVPENGIVAGCEAITPAMLPLVALTDEAIEWIVARVPGGAANVQDIYPLAPLQEGVLFHHLLAREGDPYLLNASFAFARREQLDAFFDALGHVIARHDILRTAIQWEGLSEPVQVVWRNAPLQPEEIELDAANGDIAQQLHDRFDARRLRLDLGVAPLLKLVFAHDAAQQRWVLLLIFHHLVADHEAMAEVQREVRAFLSGREHELAEPVPFRNYVAQARFGVSRDEHEAFFREMLGDVDEPTLPFGLRNVQGDGQNVEEATRRIDDDLGRRLRAQARRSGVSAATLFHLAWAVVLGKLSQRDDVVFGTVLFGRLQGQQGASRALGMFINTLPVRMTLGMSVHAAVGETHRVLTQLLRHEHASLALAQQCSGIAAPTPLFSALLNYRHSPEARLDAEESAWAAIESLGGEERTNYPVALNIDDLGDGFTLTVQTAHERGTAGRVGGYMNTALAHLVSALEDAPQTVAARLPILPAAERAVLLDEWNRTEAPYSPQRSIHEVFEARAHASPDSAALIHGDAQWSYGEVNARANRLARHLRGLGVGPDRRVALCVERGLDMVVGLLAVLKAGGAYVPLDPTYPAGRLAYMLADSAPVAVLAQAGTQALVSSLDVAQPVLLLDGPEQPWAAQAADNLARPAGLGPDSLAYVIYTSGSTGQPKGVCNTLAGLNNRLGWYADRLHGSASRTAFKTGIGFVDSVTEILETLLAGSTLVVFDRLSVMDVERLAAQIHRFQVTHLVLVPSLLRPLLSVDPGKLASVGTLVCSGEWLSPALVRETRARLPHVGLLNFYGSSEVNGDATACDYPSAEALNADASLIGRPIANIRTYILDSSHEPVPMGVTGELHVAGLGLARGYLNRPDLSAERFVPDPFAAQAGSRMYRTGDLARYRTDGTIEYLGRIDFQVKLRGFRIELGEIEAALAAQAGVREAVVLASGEAGDQRLVAYYTLEDGATSGAEALRSALAERLPDYMVPSAFMRLARLPLTPNGKLDRAALPAPDREAYASRSYVPPEGELETRLAAIWVELLEVERVGRHDHFFELGGHSLLAVRLISRVRRQFDVDVSLLDVFERPVLSELALTVSSARQSALPPLVAVPRDAGSVLPVSFAQQRMWFLTQLDDVSEAYHIPVGLRLRGSLDRAALRAALDRLMTRHEALRTTFEVVDGSPRPTIGPAQQAFALDVQDMQDGPPTGDIDAALLQRLVDEEAQAPFDLAAGPLVRGRLLGFGEHDHVLLLTMHHIVSDGWSLGILTRELGVLYEAFCNGAPDPLAPLPVQYADYAAWQRRWLDGDGLQQQTDYWRRTLAGSPALLTLPTDRPRPVRQDHAGAAIDVALDAALTADVRALSRRLGLTPYMTVLTGWAIVLAKLSGQQDVVIGTPVANRTPAEVEGLIGFFVNTLALRIDVDERKTVEALLEHVKTRTSEAQSHQGLPFEQVVEVLRPERSLSHSPLFQVMLVWHNLAPAAPTMGNLALSTLSPTRHTAKFDLLLELVETSDTIRGSLEYATALFDRETARRFSRHLDAVLRAMVAGPDRIVGAVSLLDEADRARLLAFNAVAPDYPHDRRIDALFEAQARRTPDATALVHGTQRLSYAALDARANQLAHALIEAGVNPQTRVAICVERGVDMVIAIVATMKAGAAYVPLDPGYPAQRLDYLLGDCAPAAVLAQTVTREKFGTPAAPVVLLDADAARIARQPVTAPPVSPRASGDLAYVIYTSGSTGAPKGVAMPHAALGNLVHWQRQQSGAYSDAPRTLQFAALGFDVAFQEMFGTLCAGGELHLIDAGLRLDFHGLFDYLCRQRVQRLYLPYIALQNFAEAVVAATAARAGGQLADACELREVIVAGEQLRITPQIAECFRHLPDCRLHNHYGPTESHVVVACALPADVATWPVLPPIGRPLPNVRIHVLDPCGQPVPIGASGEIYVGGVQVAHRYLNRAALTASQFVPDPFGTEPGARLYRTGDLGRWRADGSLEYLGRSDGQIKLRGFRIEPGEIEAALLSMPGITAAAVVAREDEPGDRRLVAYCTGAAATPGQLRHYLLASLPEHMVPAAYVNLAALPLTPNGKLDERALPMPAPDAVAHRGEDNDGAAPVGEIEQKLAALWAQVLKLEHVGRHDNFFELGGHSLLAVRLIELIRKTFAVDIAINTLFTCPNLNQLAKHIEFPLALASPVEMLLPIKVREAAESVPPTLFCIHPASGLSWSFAGLTRYPRGRFQIYGLQSGGIAEGTSLAPSVEAMSREYIEIIRSVQPHGPYRLIGWSMGGLVAFEVACQLQALGETVDFVGVLDSFLLYTTEVVPYDEQYTLMNILRTAGCDVSGLDPQQPLTVPEVSRLVRQEGHIFSMLSAAHVEGLVEVRRNNLAITQRYLPKRRFRGTLTHFTATNEPNRTGSPQRHWKPYVEGKIRSLPIACTHDDIGTPPYLAPIAELIDAIFEGLE